MLRVPFCVIVASPSLEDLAGTKSGDLRMLLEERTTKWQVRCENGKGEARDKTETRLQKRLIVARDC